MRRAAAAARNSGTSALIRCLFSRGCPFGLDQGPDGIERDESGRPVAVRELEFNPTIRSQRCHMLARVGAVGERVSCYARGERMRVRWALNATHWLSRSMHGVARCNAVFVSIRHDQHELTFRTQPTRVAHPDADE